MSEDIKLIKKKKSGILDLRSKGILKKYVWKPRYFILTEKGSLMYYSVDLDKV